MYLKCRTRDRERKKESIFYLLVPPQIDLSAGAGLGQCPVPGALWDLLPECCSGPSTWVIYHSFSRHIPRELTLKWSSHTTALPCCTTMLARVTANF